VTPIDDLIKDLSVQWVANSHWIGHQSWAGVSYLALAFVEVTSQLVLRRWVQKGLSEEVAVQVYSNNSGLDFLCWTLNDLLADCVVLLAH
jgi:hypothetical protein